MDDIKGVSGKGGSPPVCCSNPAVILLCCCRCCCVRWCEVRHLSKLEQTRGNFWALFSLLYSAWSETDVPIFGWFSFDCTACIGFRDLCGLETDTTNCGRFSFDCAAYLSFAICLVYNRHGEFWRFSSLICAALSLAVAAVPLSFSFYVDFPFLDPFFLQ